MSESSQPPTTTLPTSDTLERETSVDDNTTDKRRMKRLPPGVDPGLILPGGRGAKRRHGDDGNGEVDPKEEIERIEKDREDRRVKRGEAKKEGEKMWDAVVKATDDTGRVLSLAFMKLPSKRQFPAYYAVIKHPLELEQIHTKLVLTPNPTTNPLPTLLSVTNSSPPKPTGRISRVSQSAAAPVDADGDTSMEGVDTSAVEHENQKLEKVKKAYKDELNGYEGYESLEEVWKDFDLAFRNAKRFNTKESAIFADARKLHKIAKASFSQSSGTTAEEGASGNADDDMDVEHDSLTLEAAAEREMAEAEAAMAGLEDRGGAAGAGAAGGEDSKRNILNANKRRRISESAAEGTEDEAVDSLGNKIKRTYNKHAVSSYKLCKLGMTALDKLKSKDGRRMANIFDELPSKKEYADYYKIIRQPISLAEISEKLTARKYDTVEDWKSDLYLMFKNAQTYNVEGSEVFEDAAQMKAYLDGPITEEIDSKAAASPSTGPAPPSKIRIKVGGGSASVEPVPFQPEPLPAGLDPLPANVINRDLVDALYKYPESHKVAWASTMDDLNRKILSDLMKTVEAEKTKLRHPILPSPIHTPLTNLPPIPGLVPAPLQAITPSAPSLSSAPPPVVVMPPRRPPTELPLIAFINCRFDVSVPDLDAMQLKFRKKAVRLKNLRGVISHTLTIKQRTPSIELTAYLEEAKYDLMPTLPGDKSPATIASTLAHSPLPELNLRTGGQLIPGMLVYPGDDYNKRPIGCKWEVVIPPDQLHATLEITVFRRAETIPDGRPAVGETCMIFVGRQT